MRPVALAGLSEAQPDREGRAAHADRARRAEGRHLEPVDLREGDRRDRRIRRRAEAVPGRGRPRRRRDLRAPGDRRHPGGRRRAAPGLRARRSGRDGYISLEVLALSRQRHRGDDRRGAAAVGGGRPAESDGQGAGDPGRHSGDPPADRPRAQHQHHAAVRRQRLRAGGRGLSSPGSRTWQQAGGDVAKIASVASFFVSRIDTAIDKRLDAARRQARLARPRCAARSAIANAKLAYARYKALFCRRRAGRRWRRRARRRSACSGRRPAPRIRPTRTRCMSRR